MAIKLIEFPAQIPFHWWKTFWAIEGGTSNVDGRFTCIARLKDDRLCLMQEVPIDFPGEVVGPGTPGRPKFKYIALVYPETFEAAVLAYELLLD